MIKLDAIKEPTQGVMSPPAATERPLRYHITLQGGVQGVGFRPFVYRLACEYQIKGWVENSPQGVQIDAEAPKAALDQFVSALRHQAPKCSFLQRMEYRALGAAGYGSFEIRPSRRQGPKHAVIMPDLATCDACLEDIRDPANRRYRYPFTNCTYCGPRYSIVRSLPYDRGGTSMSAFQMCSRCQAEYDDPRDRRFHAQANACPDCGPHIELWTHEATSLARHHEALVAAARAIKRGAIVALKGIGGFQLIADATNEIVVQRLRQRKGRQQKPFALMAASIEQAETFCCPSALERELLSSAEAPIVLIRGAAHAGLAAGIAPDNPYVGVMLPYSPLHHLLMMELDGPVVATSGNYSEEPILIDNQEAVTGLAKLADHFLVHNRVIAHHVDDSIVRVIGGRSMVLRRARGYTPRPLALPQETSTLLALGAHQKNTIALSWGDQLIIGPHVGDLEDVRAADTFVKTIETLEDIYDVKPLNLICDLHPDYRSTEEAYRRSVRPRQIQHHLAHVFSCMADNGCAPPLLGIAWDGTGYGQDGTVWGGECFHVGCTGVERVASLRPFRLPGGQQAVREPRRSAFGLLYEVFGQGLLHMKRPTCLRGLSEEAVTGLAHMCAKGINSPWTSSVGRLFDGVSALLGLSNAGGFEGQAAMNLEFAAEGVETEQRYPCDLLLDTGRLEGDRAPLYRMDWQALIAGIIEDKMAGVAVGVIARKFHCWLVDALVQVADRLGGAQVLLSGGCFQNRTLTELAVARLRARGYVPYWHKDIPPNDGGIAAGQILAATYQMQWRQD